MPLDDVDRRLLNLMQGSFPIAPRPYQHIASLAEIQKNWPPGKPTEGRT